MYANSITTPCRNCDKTLSLSLNPHIIGLLVDEVLMVYRLGEAEIEVTAHNIGNDVGTYIAGVARPTDARADGTGFRSGLRKEESVSKVAGRLTDRNPGDREAANATAAAANEVVLILLDLKTLLATN